MVTVGLAACLALLLPSGAAGELTNAADPAGDVVVVEIDAGPNSEHYATLRPKLAHGDIRSFHANHAHAQLFVGLRFRNINPTKWTYQEIAVRTPQWRYLVTFEHKGNRVTYKELQNETRDTWPRCPGLEVRVNVTKDRVQLFVPRGCLGRPRWMRVGAQTDSVGYDDALRRGRNDRDWRFDGPALGPRLSRGHAH